MHKEKLKNIIIEEINKYKGSIPFSKFMYMALYQKNLGYYTSKNLQIGTNRNNDFVTSPLISSLFNITLGKYFEKILDLLGKKGSIIEFGAGNGDFALGCLKYLHERKRLPSKYFIVEISSKLRDKQKKLLKKNFFEYFDKIIWLEKPPEYKIDAIVFANEFLDSLPVELFLYDKKELFQIMVSYKKNFSLQKNPDVPSNLKKSCKKLEIKNQDYYFSEINLNIKKWFYSLSKFLSRGVIVICDYGYQEKLYYSEERTMGTLTCYYKHKKNFNPLMNIGKQDITAHINFTEVADTAINAGFKLNSFSSQGNFLRKAGIIDCYKKIYPNLNDQNKMLLRNELKKLILFPDISETFKVMTLTKKFDNLEGIFDDVDMSYLL